MMAEDDNSCVRARFEVGLKGGAEAGDGIARSTGAPETSADSGAVHPFVAPHPTDTLLRADPRAFPPFEEVFGNPGAVEIEIGCGKGKFLIARAEAHPEINFLGIDIVWKWMKLGVERSSKHGLVNTKFSKLEAREFVKYGIADESVSVFHIYFPDPWPKRRHRKRRLITGAFLTELHRCLGTDGLIELATDHEDYFGHMRAAVVQSGVAWQRTAENRDNRPFEALSKTNYEIKYEAAGRALHYIELQK